MLNKLLHSTWNNSQILGPGNEFNKPHQFKKKFITNITHFIFVGTFRHQPKRREAAEVDYVPVV